MPTDLGAVTAVAAGDLHALALKSGGSAVAPARGDNPNGQATIPAGLAGAISPQSRPGETSAAW